MRIYIAEEKTIVCRDRRCSKFIYTELPSDESCYILAEDGFYEYYSCCADMYCFRMCDSVGSVSSAEIEFLREVAAANDSKTSIFPKTADAFMQKHQLPENVLMGIFENIAGNEKLLEPGKKTQFLELVRKFCQGKLSDQDEKGQLLKLCGIIETRFEDEINALYLDVAGHLIRANITAFKAIRLYARTEGYCTYMICSAMVKLGVKPRCFVNRRRDILQEVLEKMSPDKSLQKRKIFILSGPSCSGKTTVFTEVTKAFPSLVRTVSDTTRKPRPGEKDGVDYHFITFEAFKKRKEERGYEEITFYDNNFYGTLADYFRTKRKESLVMIIETNGAEKIKRRYEDVVSIFIMPPSEEELQKRLVLRGDNTAQEMERRLYRAKREMKKSAVFDHIVVNDNLQEAVREVENIISSYIC